MRKIYTIILLVLSIILLAACGNAADGPEPTGEPTPTETVQPTPEPTSEVTPEPTPETTPETTPEPTPELTPESMCEAPYTVKVNLECNTVTVYCTGEDGEQVPYKAMVCSTGTATPKAGKYDIRWQGKWEWLSLFGDVYGHYCTQITGNILFHSVPYMEYGNSGSLEYWQFDQLGTACSMGCIRLQVIDAKWIFDNKEDIYTVEFYSDPDPGPLGKPVPPNIGDNVECRGWDPTDPDPNNPWNLY